MDSNLSATEKGLGRWKQRRNQNEDDSIDTSSRVEHGQKPKPFGMMRLVSVDGTVQIIKNYDEAGKPINVDFKAEREKFLQNEKIKKEKPPKDVVTNPNTPVK